MYELLIEPITTYGFFASGLVVAVAVGIGASVLSCLLVVRRQALLGEAVSHSVLLGVAVGFLVAGSVGVLPGALLAAVGTSLAATFIERRTPLPRDAALGIVFTTAFAGGLAVISIARPRGIDLFHVLLGNVLGVSSADVAISVLTTAVVVGGVVALFRPLRLWAFDASLAPTLGVRVGVLEYTFAVLLSAMVVASLQAVGLVLVVAMLVTPGATARLVTTRLSTMMVVAVGVGVSSAVVGLYLSYHVDLASGPAMVLVAGAQFLLALLATPGPRTQAA